MRLSCFHVAILPLLIFLCLLPVCAQCVTDAELRDILANVDSHLSQYTQRLRDVTATETRVDELYDNRGRLRRKRVVESDLVILDSRIERTPQEYLVVRKIDGRPLRNSDRRAIEFLSKLAKSTTEQAELQRLRNENFRHVLGIRFYGIILSPFIAASESLIPFFDFTIAGTEVIEGHETVIVEYKQIKQTEDIAFEIRSPPELSISRAFLAGRVWVSRQEGKIFRIEEQGFLLSERFSKPFEFMSRSMEFRPGEFGSNFPTRIIWETYSPVLDRKIVRRTEGRLTPGTRLTARSVSIFGEFRRFNVENPAAEITDLKENK